ncbi:MAG TPA: asparaginase [Arachnia sp.]|nr:asparaginase [Arachnia sp.]HMT86856.1 asparaginase [Arachnia sp.]
MVHESDPVVAEVRRGDIVECLHHGSVAVTRPGGGLRLAVGQVDAPMLPRSALKPLQAVAMLRHGLDLSGAELALVGASHSAEAFHLDGVLSILDGAGLPASALQTTPALPGDATALADWLRAGRDKEPLAHCCSGKHAGMLRTCARNDWPTPTYLAPEHPLQAALHRTVAELTGDDLPGSVPDGCGAPAFTVTLAGLARAFGRLAAASDGPEKLVADAFRLHPEYASGTTRAEPVFHREVPGLICKSGAEGVLAVGLDDGTGIAVKISDGADRATVAVLVALLGGLGLTTPALEALNPYPVLGHGAPVGRVVSRLGLPERLRDS